VGAVACRWPHPPPAMSGAVEDAGDLAGVEAEPAGDGVGVQALVVQNERAADFLGGKGFGGAGLDPSGFGDQSASLCSASVKASWTGPSTRSAKRSARWKAARKLSNAARSSR